MPVISKIGRASPAVRFLFLLMYAFLVLGSATIIGPFLMMLSSSVSSEADIADYRIVPKFVTDDTALFARHLNDKYSRDLAIVRELYRYELPRIDVGAGTVAGMVNMLGLPEQLADPAQRLFLNEYDQFLSRDIPLDLYQVTHEAQGELIGPLNALYQDWLKERFKTVAGFNRAYSEQYDYWAEIKVPSERIIFRDWSPLYNQQYRDFLEFKSGLPARLRRPLEGRDKWVNHLRFIADSDIERLNTILGTGYRGFWEVPMPLVAPQDPALLKAWEDFVRRKWPLRLVQINEDGQREYRHFVQQRRTTIERVNESYGSHYASFEQLDWPTAEECEGTRQSDLIEFVRGELADLPKLSMANVRLRTASGAFREWLLPRHGGTLDGINAALGAHFGRVEDIVIPQPLWDWNELTAHRAALRWECIQGNYFEVISFILTKGRALRNTVIFIIASVLITLTVNPLCAYALSRFNLSCGHRVLLFLLATMAFPGEVTMIPNFLLLRDLGMLNTFYALILPGMASGFTIFILKGFFDTLPKELYEAAQLDGAGELRMFYQITVPLCQPVFAYIALMTFTGAYGSFLFALTICQDPKMWTIMVWLYDLNATAPEHIKVAALTVAMLPTLLVFVTCQRVIMRGIILPEMQ